MTVAVPRLAALLEPVVQAAGHDLEDLTVTSAGRRQVVRVLVDKDGGTSLDDVAEVTRAVSEALDDIDAREPALLNGSYVLEVSSPGVDRPLTAPRHWRRNVGRLVKVVLQDGREVGGRLTAAGEQQITVEQQVLPLADVRRGQVQVEFARLAPTDEPPAGAHEDGPDEDGPDEDGPDEDGPDEDGPDESVESGNRG